MRAPGLYLVRDVSSNTPMVTVAEWIEGTQLGLGGGGAWSIPGRDQEVVEKDVEILAGPMAIPPSKELFARLVALVQTDMLATQGRQPARVDPRFEKSVVRVCERFAIADWLAAKVHENGLLDGQTGEEDFAQLLDQVRGGGHVQS